VINIADALTVVIFTSPVPSHPSDWILENVYVSIRNHLPDCRILILADGVNGTEPEDYKAFKRTVAGRGHEILEFTGSHHQTLMLKHCLDNGVIKTPLVLVGEHDWGIQDLSISWEEIIESVLDPAVPFQLVQIKQGDFGDWEKDHFGNSLQTRGITLRETNWFQGPMHIASCEWYRGLVSEFTKPDFLECDQMDAALHVNNRIKEMACYIPKGVFSPGRLYHLDGRNAKDFYLAPGMFVLSE
jgi:hypothetical protein